MRACKVERRQFKEEKSFYVCNKYKTEVQEKTYYNESSPLSMFKMRTNTVKLNDRNGYLYTNTVLDGFVILSVILFVRYRNHFSVVQFQN